MKVSKRVNAIRRSLMRRLTGAIHNTRLQQGGITPAAVKRVLICRPNKRLGNLLLLTPLMQELSRTFPGCRIDLFVEGKLAGILFQHYEVVNRIIWLPNKPFKHLFGYLGKWFSVPGHRYDLAINATEFSSSGRISTLASRARYKLLGVDRDAVTALHPGDAMHAGKYPVYALRYYLSGAGISEPSATVPPLDLKLSEEEKNAGRDALQSLVADPSRPTICIFTYATGEKCYSPDWWEPLYAALKATYPAYNILEVLPKENVSQIGFRAPTFYSLDVRAIGAVIAATRVFIGADSGMMHLASAVHTPTVGLFSVTDARVFGPYGNGSVAVTTDGDGVGAVVKALAHILK